MNWTDLLRSHIHLTYAATEGLLDMVDDEMLDWKPATGENWMTTGQLLTHLTTACGFCFRGFLTNDWTPPEGYEIPEPEGGETLLPAEKLPKAESVAKVKELLASDKRLALATIEEAGEKRLAGDTVKAPWEGQERLMGEQFLFMIQHLAQHKGQLFYYLKLQGKPVNTSDLWGM
ncbi:MAG: DinB family protein [bacterium]|nr:DinB family protein [bacterium]